MAYFKLDLLTFSAPTDNYYESKYLSSTISEFYTQKDEYAKKQEVLLPDSFSFCYSYDESVSLHKNSQKNLSFKMDKKVLKGEEWILNPFIPVLKIGSTLLLTDKYDNQSLFSITSIDFDIKEDNATYSYTCQDSFTYILSAQNVEYSIENDPSSEDFIGAKTIDWWAYKIWDECKVSYQYLPLAWSYEDGISSANTDTNGTLITPYHEKLKEKKVYNKDELSDTDKSIFYSTITFSGSGSANSLLISLADQYGLMLIVKEYYDKDKNTLQRFFWFEPSKDDQPSGLTYSPYSDLQSFGLSASGDNLGTVLNVKGGQVGEDLVTLLPEVPSFFAQYFLSEYWDKSTSSPTLFTDIATSGGLKIFDETNISSMQVESLYNSSTRQNESWSLIPLGEITIPRFYDRVRFKEVSKEGNAYSIVTAVGESVTNAGEDFYLGIGEPKEVLSFKGQITQGAAAYMDGLDSDSKSYIEKDMVEDNYYVVTYGYLRTAEEATEEDYNNNQAILISSSDPMYSTSPYWKEKIIPLTFECGATGSSETTIDFEINYDYTEAPTYVSLTGEYVSEIEATLQYLYIGNYLDPVYTGHCDIIYTISSGTWTLDDRDLHLSLTDVSLTEQITMVKEDEEIPSNLLDKEQTLYCLVSPKTSWVSEVTISDLTLYLEFYREGSEEDYEFAQVADQVPWLENKLINFSYYYNAGIINKKTYQSLNTILKEDLRKNNGKLLAYLKEYYSAIHKKTKVISDITNRMDLIGANISSYVVNNYARKGTIATDLSRLEATYLEVFSSEEKESTIINYDETLADYVNKFIDCQQRFLKNIYNFTNYFNTPIQFGKDLSIWKYNISLEQTGQNQKQYYAFSTSGFQSATSSAYDPSTGELLVDIYKNESGSNYSLIKRDSIVHMNNMKDFYVLKGLDAYTNVTTSMVYQPKFTYWEKDTTTQQYTRLSADELLRNFFESDTTISEEDLETTYCYKDSSNMKVQMTSFIGDLYGTISNHANNAESLIRKALIYMCPTLTFSNHAASFYLMESLPISSLTYIDGDVAEEVPFVNIENVKNFYTKTKYSSKTYEDLTIPPTDYSNSMPIATALADIGNTGRINDRLKELQADSSGEQKSGSWQNSGYTNADITFRPVCDLTKTPILSFSKGGFDDKNDGLPSMMFVSSWEKYEDAVTANDFSELNSFIAPAWYDFIEDNDYSNSDYNVIKEFGDNKDKYYFDDSYYRLLKSTDTINKEDSSDIGIVYFPADTPREEDLLNSWNTLLNNNSTWPTIVQDVSLANGQAVFKRLSATAFFGLGTMATWDCFAQAFLNNSSITVEEAILATIRAEFQNATVYVSALTDNENILKISCNLNTPIRPNITVYAMILKRENFNYTILEKDTTTNKWNYSTLYCYDLQNMELKYLYNDSVLGREIIQGYWYKANKITDDDVCGGGGAEDEIKAYLESNSIDVTTENILTIADFYRRTKNEKGENIYELVKSAPQLVSSGEAFVLSRDTSYIVYKVGSQDKIFSVPITKIVENSAQKTTIIEYEYDVSNIDDLSSAQQVSITKTENGVQIGETETVVINDLNKYYIEELFSLNKDIDYSTTGSLILRETITESILSTEVVSKEKYVDLDFSNTESIPLYDENEQQIAIASFSSSEVVDLSDASGLSNGQFWYYVNFLLSDLIQGVSENEKQHVGDLLFEYQALIETELTSYWNSAYNASIYCDYFLPESWQPNSEDTSSNYFAKDIIILNNSSTNKVRLSNKYIPEVIKYSDDEKNDMPKKYLWRHNEVCKAQDTETIKQIIGYDANEFIDLSAYPSDNYAIENIKNLFANWGIMKEGEDTWTLSEYGYCNYYYSLAGGTKWKDLFTSLQVPNSNFYTKIDGWYPMFIKYFSSKFKNKEYTNYKKAQEKQTQYWKQIYQNYPGIIVEKTYSNTDALDSLTLLEFAQSYFKDIYKPAYKYSVSVIDVSSLKNYIGQELKIGSSILLNVPEITEEYDDIYSALSNYLFISDISYSPRKDGDISLTVDTVKWEDKLIKKLAKLVK